MTTTTSLRRGFDLSPLHRLPLCHATEPAPDRLKVPDKLSVAEGGVIGCAVARLRLSWWYLHPVLFLVWGTWACLVLSASFLVGWVIKVVLVRLGGVKTYQTAKPLMIGVIAGELAACFGWTIVGVIYYMATDRIPVTYRILPG